jgi:hypothetical protein
MAKGNSMMAKALSGTRQKSVLWVLGFTILAGARLAGAAEPGKDEGAKEPPKAVVKVPVKEAGKDGAREGGRDLPKDLFKENSQNAGRLSASEIAEIINGLEYPELQVVPRASERLRLEAKEEESNWAYAHLPIEMAGLATLGTGFLAVSQERPGLTDAQKADMKTVATVTQAVGAGWLVAGLAMGLAKPYDSGLSRIAKLGGKDERTLLLRERLAEEALERPARLIRPLTVAAVVTNLGMNVLMGTYLTDQGRILAGVSAVLSFLPAIYEDPSVAVYEKHLEYKKKIYGPVSSTGLGYDSSGHSFYPQTALTWRF